jgi:hypothetical protein
MLQLSFEPVVMTMARRLIDKCRYVDFTQDERCPVLIRANVVRPAPTAYRCLRQAGGREVARSPSS